MAGGFKDATRTASGMPWLGADVLRYNRRALKAAVKEFFALMEELLESSPEEAENLFREAGSWRRDFLEEKRTRWTR